MFGGEALVVELGLHILSDTELHVMLLFIRTFFRTVIHGKLNNCLQNRVINLVVERVRHVPRGREGEEGRLHAAVHRLGRAVQI